MDRVSRKVFGLLRTSYVVFYGLRNVEKLLLAPRWRRPACVLNYGVSEVGTSLVGAFDVAPISGAAVTFVVGDGVGSVGDCVGSVGNCVGSVGNCVGSVGDGVGRVGDGVGGGGGGGDGLGGGGGIFGPHSSRYW